MATFFIYRKRIYINEYIKYKKNEYIFLLPGCPMKQAYYNKYSYSAHSITFDHTLLQMQYNLTGKSNLIYLYRYIIH